MAKSREQLIYGLRAGLAVGVHRPDAILRVFHSEAVRGEIGPLLKAAAARRRPYREVEDEELERITKARHHEGLAVIAQPPTPTEAADLLDAVAADPKGILLAIDGVENPHNQGAILRSAAWFGALGLVVRGKADLSPATCRVAQGAAEVVPVASVRNMAAFLGALRKSGVMVVAADQSARPGDGAFVDPPAGPLCVVLGSEATGLSHEVQSACRMRVAVPGSGAVESLNVSVAAGALLALLRQTRRPNPLPEVEESP